MLICDTDLRLEKVDQKLATVIEVESLIVVIGQALPPLEDREVGIGHG